MKESDSVYDHWIKELDAEEKSHKDWRSKSEKIIKRYRDEEKREDARFNILWSNIQTLHAAIYSNTPNPDVSRRFTNSGKSARDVAEIVQKVLSYDIDSGSLDSTISDTIDDYLLVGLGVSRVRYQPYFEKGEPPKISVSMETRIGEDGNETTAFMNDDEQVETENVAFDEKNLPYILGEPVDEIVYQEITDEPVPWNRFRWQPATNWQGVTWTGIDHYLTKEEIEEQLPSSNAEDIPLGYTDSGDKSDKNDDGKQRALIHEIFDLSHRKVLFICKGYKKVIYSVDDPLEIEKFYPHPKPLFANTTTTKLIPVPDYLMYQDQAEELDELTNRINVLTRELKYRGVYDSTFEKLQNVASNGDGEFEPVENFTERFGAGKSLSDVIKTMPLDELLKVISGLYAAREQAKQLVYEITGISDIVRGSTKASETATAQQIKGNFANLRLENRRREINRYIRDILRLKAEIISEHFEPKTLTIMTGIEVTDEMMQIMKSDLLRKFKIDVESDSTSLPDRQAEQESRNNFMTTVSTYLQTIAPAAMQGLLPKEFAKELLIFITRSYKGGRTLEDAINMDAQQQTMGSEQMPPQAAQQNNIVPIGGMSGPI